VRENAQAKAWVCKSEGAYKNVSNRGFIPFATQQINPEEIFGVYVCNFYAIPSSAKKLENQGNKRKNI
jgi:hypothetical protein